MNFFGRTYILIFTAMVSSAIIYPLSVRFVKKVFRLKSFFNIHFVNIHLILGCDTDNGQLECSPPRSNPRVFKLLLSISKVSFETRLTHEKPLKSTLMDMLHLVLMFLLISIYVMLCYMFSLKYNNCSICDHLKLLNLFCIFVGLN